MANPYKCGTKVYLKPGELFPKLYPQFGKQEYEGIIEDIYEGVAFITLREGGISECNGTREVFLTFVIPLDDLTFVNKSSLKKRSK